MQACALEGGRALLPPLLRAGACAASRQPGRQAATHCADAASHNRHQTSNFYSPLGLPFCLPACLQRTLRRCQLAARPSWESEASTSRVSACLQSSP